MTLSELTGKIQDVYARSVRHARQAIEDSIEIGRLLAEIKNQVPHGSWIGYIEENFEFGERQAQKYIRLAENSERVLEKRTDSSYLTEGAINGALALIATPKAVTAEPTSRRCPKCGAQISALDAHEHCAICRGERKLAGAGSAGKPETKPDAGAPRERFMTEGQSFDPNEPEPPDEPEPDPRENEYVPTVRPAAAGWSIEAAKRADREYVRRQWGGCPEYARDDYRKFWKSLIEVL